MRRQQWHSEGHSGHVRPVLRQIVFTLQLQSLILTLVCFIIQLLAMVWYSLSFIVSPPS